MYDRKQFLVLWSKIYLTRKYLKAGTIVNINNTIFKFAKLQDRNILNKT